MGVAVQSSYLVGVDGRRLRVAGGGSVEAAAHNPTLAMTPNAAAAVASASVHVGSATVDTSSGMSFAQYKAAVNAEMVGYAAYGGVTGGLNGSLYVVNTTANSGAGSLRDALSASNRWIVFDRTVFPKTTETTIALSSPIDMRNVNNVTVDGFGARVRITGFGITTGQWGTTSISNVSNNLCLLNLKITNISAGNYDCLTIDGTDRAWFYHLELSTAGDGNLDITQTASGPNPFGYMTIQNCYIHDAKDAGKNCLLGDQTATNGDYLSSTSSYPSGNGGDNRISIVQSRFKDRQRNPVVANYWVHMWNCYIHDWELEGPAVMGCNAHLRAENNVLNPGSAPSAHAAKGLYAWTFSYPDSTRRYKRWSNTGNAFLTGANGTATELNAAGSTLNPAGSIFTVPYAYTAANVTSDSGSALIAQLTSSNLATQGRAGCVDRNGYYDLVVTTGTSTTTFTPTVIDLSATEITNPWHGQYIWNGNAPRPTGWPVTDTYARPAWRQLESTQGNYTFSSIESLCADAQSRGGRATLGIFSLYYGGGPSWYRAVPDYLADNPAAGTFSNNYFIPDWNSEAYLSRWEALMEAIAAEFGDDIRFGGIDVRGYGNYGEWHEYDSPDLGGITDNNAKRLVDATLDNFLGTNTRIFMLSAHVVAMEYALLQSPDIGIRADSLGANEIGGATWFMDRVVERGQVDPYERWKVAPFITEWPWFTNSDLFPVGHQQVQDYHISHLSSGNIHPTQPTTNADFEGANKKSGARIVLSSVTLPSSVKLGQSFTLTSRWLNVNVAPPYDAFNVNFELRSGSTVVWSGTSSLDLRSLLPTGGTASAVADTFTVSGISPGSYTLHVKIPWQDNGGYLQPYNLAITGRTGDGAYPLGTVTVSS